MKSLTLFTFVLMTFLFRVSADDSAEAEDYDESKVNSVSKLFSQLCNLNHTIASHDESFCNCDTVQSPVIGRPAQTIDCTLSDGVGNLTNEFFRAEKLPANTVSLILSYHLFTSIPFFVGDLNELDMSNNVITVIKELNFANIKSLEKLDLSYNQISEIQTSAFSSLTLLHELDLTSNKLIVFPSNTFAPLTTLKVLKLSSNEGFGRIMGKDDKGSSLVKLYQQLGVSLGLRSLEMERCNLSAIYLMSGHGLEQLNLGYNEIVDFTKLELPPNLRKLELSGNPVRDLNAFTLAHVYNVHELILEDMPYMGQVEENSLFGLSKLTHLSLEGSKNLSFFDPFAFNVENETNLELKVLNLRGCNLRSLSTSLKDIFDGLDELHLDGNPFNCDCDLQWMKNVHLEANVQCNKPPELHGKLLSEIDDKEMKCSKMSIFMKKLVNGLILLTLLIGCSLTIWCFFRQLSPRNRRKQFQKVGPESPYQRVTIEPNRAEYSLQ